MRLSNGFVIKEKTFEKIKFTAVHNVFYRIGTGTQYPA